MYVSIDKIKIAYRLPISYYDGGLKFTPFKDLEKFINDYMDKPYFNNSAYPRGVNMLYDLGSFAFDKNRILWEFNPNTIQKNDRFIESLLIRLNEVNEWHETRDKHFTRIDIAIDLDIDLNAYNWFLEGAIEKTIKLKNNAVETVYLGSRNSDIYFRIYDKEKESKAQEMPLPEYMTNWKYKTRIELEYKGKETLTLDKLNRIFKRLIIIPKSTNFNTLLTVCDDVQDCLALAHVIEHDLYNYIEDLPRRQKDRLKRVLKKVDVSDNYTNILEAIKFDNVINRLDKFYQTLNIFDLYSLPF